VKTHEQRQAEFRQAIQVFHASARGPDDYMKLLCGTASAFRQGVGMGGSEIEEQIRLALTAVE